MRARRLIRPVLFVAVVAICGLTVTGALGLPTAYVSAAPDQTYIVDSNGDDGDNNIGDGDLCGRSTLAATALSAPPSRRPTRLRRSMRSTSASPPTATTIRPTYTLPTISAPLIIDGTTQTGFAGTPIVELDGLAGSGPGVDGLLVTAGGTTVRGLWIYGFGRYGIDLRITGGNVVEGNWIGDLR